MTNIPSKRPYSFQTKKSRKFNHELEFIDCYAIMFDLVFTWLQSCKGQEASESAFIATADNQPVCRRKASEGPGTN